MRDCVDWKIAIVLTLFSMLCISSDAQAQGQVGRRPGQIGRPTTSPYLNLLNGAGGNPDLNIGLNYYQQVRPQQQFRSAIGQLQRSQQLMANSIANSQQATQAPTSQLGATGHPTSFQNLGNYFPLIQNRNRR